jgi:hypothetical protein
VSGIVITAVLMAIPPNAGASVSPTARATASVSGTVYAIAQVGNRTIVGGDFSAVGGTPRRNVAAILPDGTVDPAFDPGTDGVVRAVAGSEDGGRVFIGGDFTSVAGQPRVDLAALDATTAAVIADWRADTNGVVNALAVKGARLYAGGTFTAIGPSTRRRLSALDVTTGSVILAFNPWPGWTVKAVAVSPDGTKVYAAGFFETIGGQPRNGAAELDASDGQATPFNPLDTNVALTLGLTPDGSRLFVSTTNNRMYAYDPAVSSSPVYVTQTSGDVQAIAASATEVYIGGHFSQLQDFRLKRARLASLRVSDGLPTTWAPKISQSYLGVWAITATVDSVIVGGDFLKVNNKVQSGLAYFPGSP